MTGHDRRNATLEELVSTTLSGASSVDRFLLGLPGHLVAASPRSPSTFTVASASPRQRLPH